MKFKPKIRWPFIFIAIPIGGFLGYFIGYEICLQILFSQGKGQSPDDVISMVGAGALAGFVGTIILPVFVWFLTRKKNVK